MKDRKEPDKQDLQIKRTIAKMSGFAVSVVFSVIVGFLLGRFLDSKLGSSPTFLIIGTLLGIIAAFKSMYDIAKKDWDK